MNGKPHKDDIGIGPDRWIEFGDLSGRQAQAVAIDPCLAAVMSLIDALETDCVAACCGIDAFGFWPDEIAVAVSTLDRAALARLADDLLSVQRAIDALPSDLVVSTRMNQFFRKAVLLELLAHIRTTIDAIRSQRIARDAST
ncbi:DUF6331 family protein [Burkholderia cepacia]|uniref:Uncharacterized protein n=1 Tax=Burkholderia cepacia TaxID=292 RepID=A0ABM6P2U9_BURCE|nr:DUF6331 family protein [Burkholderia cepacia]AIO28077.1 hypothetical protein DM41_6090 [Burkholderia cepacia ATCC 25416]ALK22169.1 hypothetical protein APZ15_31240 [Burkholderia cepacia ATCC 25416]ASE97760.1 hypothetical protein CEQ23_30500 [Burkholderia cepacia]ATF81278.1 hypothetical protein CO711_28370 [Burkholderia cepacia]MCA8464379.1 DUF6331 family protein [Burkholderia cepacia]